MPISLPQEASSLRTGSHQRMILACTRPILVGHAVELATAQPPPTTTARSKPTPRLAQHRLRQLRARGSDSGRRRAGHGPSGRPRRPRPSQPYGCLPHRRAPGPHFGRTQRTRQRTNTGRPHRTPDSGTGQRTPGRSDARTGHWTSVPWTGKRGHWSLAPDTGHRTPDTGRGRGQADEGAAGIRTSWATTPSDRALGRPTVFLWTAPAALGSPCRLGGEAAFQREIASHRQLLGRSAGVERRLGALLSSDDYGSSVERTATLHPLWQARRGTCSWLPGDDRYGRWSPGGGRPSVDDVWVSPLGVWGCRLWVDVAGARWR